MKHLFMRNKYFLCVFFLNTLFAYGQQNTGIPVIQVNEKSETVELKLSDICSDVSYTKLEFDDKYPVARISTIHVTNEYIFLLSTATILRYTRDGKKVIKIGSIGQGPGEYLTGSDFAVDEINSKMYIKSNYTRNILVYDCDKNKYLYKFGLPYPSDFDSEIEKANNDKILMLGIKYRRHASTVRYFTYKLLNPKGEIIYEYTNPYFIKPKTEHQWQADGGKSCNTWMDDDYSFCSIHEKGADTIYRISSDLQMTPRFIVNCPIPRYNDHNACFYAETSKYLFWYFYNGNTKRTFFGYYDKEVKKSFIHKQVEFEGLNATELTRIKNRGVINDLDGGIPVMIPHSSHSSSHWHFFVEPFDLIEYVNSLEFKQAVVKDPKKKEELVRFVKTLVEDDNPVLVTLTLK